MATAHSKYPSKAIAVRVRRSHGGAGRHGGWGPRQYPQRGYPLYPSMQVRGSWYQRPYPTHLDYFRFRTRSGLPYQIVPSPEELVPGDGVLLSP